MTEFDRSYGTVTSRFYDAAYEAMSDQRGDQGFYASLARDAGGPVLELGCGTGRVLLEIAELGIPCSGLDASRAMLDALRAKSPPPTLRLVEAEMQDFDLGEDRFSLIFAGFRVFQHMYSVEDQLRCLACVRKHLAPGGHFAFDLFRPRIDWQQTHRPEREQLRFEIDGDLVVRHEEVNIDHEAQTIHVRMRYEVHRDGVVVENPVAEFDMRWFHRFELEHLLARAGFEIVELYGDFDRRPSAGDAPQFIVVARVPPAAVPPEGPR